MHDLYGVDAVSTVVVAYSLPSKLNVNQSGLQNVPRR